MRTHTGHIFTYSVHNFKQDTPYKSKSHVNPTLGPHGRFLKDKQVNGYIGHRVPRHIPRRELQSERNER